MNNPKISLAKKTYVIGSGKGGVGKSTVTVNLAVAMANLGCSVGLLDADLYGPSIPIMLGLRRLSPSVHSNEKVVPFTKFGIKSISIGYFIEEARSVIWRGPMLHGTLQKMIYDVDWGDLDFLFVDLPPGTGDTLLSLSQLISIDSGMIVCTPQEVAMLDAIKAINAFENLNIPLMGVIENMAGFTVPETGQMYPIFGEGKAKELAQRFQVPLMGSIPLIPAIRIGGDEGYPAAYHQGNDNAGQYFRDLAAVIKSYEANPFL